MGILLGNSYGIVTEAYYGKPKELLECEKAFAKIIDAINGKGDGLLVGGKAINNSNEIKIIKKNICKLFDLNNFNLYITDTMIGAMGNAVTPVSFIKVIPGGEKILKSTKTFSVTTIIDKSLIYEYQLTPQETVAIMLHEIGHNFDRSFFTFLSSAIPYFPFSNSSIAEKAASHIRYLLNISFLSEPYFKIIGLIQTQISNILEKNEAFRKYYTLLVSSVSSVKKVISYFNIGQALSMVLIHPERYLASIANPQAFFGYAGEKYADSFASSYGYGVEIASSMRKIQTGGLVEKELIKIPVFGICYDMARVASSMVFLMADPHPNNGLRIYSQLKKMERELNDPSIPKELKPEIAQQIKELKKMTEQMMDIKADENKNMLATTLFNSVFIGTFKGKIDPREMLETIWRHEE